ncbi:hypothetical protein FFLO_01423 [Filobasidium floriforme]|uniref:GPI-anchor transamidase n=1 Tax=Filobasidium floriforme TaxID=5210 RepID=A0A8K0JPK7_9TREE|nr:hypothetical protein FFLO_01423 [Filobasidium floriforme]
MWDLWTGVQAEVLGTSEKQAGPWQAVANRTSELEESEEGRHTNNWAVLVCTSRYWFNYRHMANTLGMYRTVKRLGIPDSRIILMLADDVACNPRNGFPSTIYANSGKQLDLYGSGVDAKKTGVDEAVGVEVDYRGYEVNVESFLRVLTGRYPDSLPASKRLLSDSSSNVFIYMAGHGGDEFMKFQDNEEVGAHDIGDAIGQMWEKRRYNKLFFMTDTCQANTLYKRIYSPNVLATGSSELGENSYSHHNDHDIGVAVIDSYTHYVLQYLEGIDIGSNKTMKDFFDHYDPVKIKSHPGVFTEYFPDRLDEVLVTDFFGGVSRAEGVERVSPGHSDGLVAVAEGHDVRSDDQVEISTSSRQRPLIRQGYLLGHPKMTLISETDRLGVTKARGWREWVALSGLVGLGGIAWAASSR